MRRSGGALFWSVAMSTMRTAGGRLFLALSGEALQSIFHFCLNLLLIRQLNPHQYGVFAVIFVLGGIALTYSNAVVSIPAGVHIARQSSEAAKHVLDVTFGSAALAISAGI